MVSSDDVKKCQQMPGYVPSCFPGFMVPQASVPVPKVSVHDRLEFPQFGLKTSKLEVPVSGTGSSGFSRKADKNSIK